MLHRIFDSITKTKDRKLPGQVKPTNIRHTHFSRNPKIAAFLKAYHFVKEFGEGFDCICREQEANGANIPFFRTDEFILKITVSKVAENVQKQTGNVTENGGKVAEKLREKAAALGETLTANRIKILELMIEDPYISRELTWQIMLELAKLQFTVISKPCVVNISVE